MPIKRALFGMLVAAGMALSLLGLGAAPAEAGISHVGGDKAPTTTSMSK